MLESGVYNDTDATTIYYFKNGQNRVILLLLISINEFNYLFYYKNKSLKVDRY